MGMLVIRALLLGVHIRAPAFWKLSRVQAFEMLAESWRCRGLGSSFFWFRDSVGPGLIPPWVLGRSVVRQITHVPFSTCCTEKRRASSLTLMMENGSTETSEPTLPQAKLRAPSLLAGSAWIAMRKICSTVIALTWKASGLVSITCGLLWGMVACHFGLFGFSGYFSGPPIANQGPLIQLCSAVVLLWPGDNVHAGNPLRQGGAY